MSRAPRIVPGDDGLHAIVPGIVGELKQEHEKRQVELRRKQDELTAFRQVNGIYSGADDKTIQTLLVDNSRRAFVFA